MSTILSFSTDVQGQNAYAPYTSIDKYSATLATDTATSITVPSNHNVWIAVFSYQPGASVWVNMTGATAAVPAGGTLAYTTSELNPGVRTVNKGTQISMITSGDGVDVGVSLYAISYP